MTINWICLSRNVRHNNDKKKKKVECHSKCSLYGSSIFDAYHILDDELDHTDVSNLIRFSSHTYFLTILICSSESILPFETVL